MRSAVGPAAACARWRTKRDDLFRTHPAVAAPDRSRGRRSPASRTSRTTRSFACWPRSSRVEPSATQIGSSGEESIAFHRFARARFSLAGAEHELELYWLTGYGGGLFLPFRDETSGSETYGGGRYLFDTVKGADLGSAGERLVLDFNFAYNPSCSYDPRWVCPLSPPANRLPVAIRAGERMPS